MSNAIPPIMVQIAADVSQLKAGLAQAQASIKGMDGTVATANTGMQNMIGTAKKMAGAMGLAFAATQVVQFGKDVVMSASSMNESISKVNVVFGASAEAVFKFGDAAAKNMGMSNQAAIEAAGTYGNLFQAFGIGQGKANEMSTTLVQLAADLGSFNNTSTEEAINALRSGLAGETEPLKRFGVALNEVTLKNKAMAMGFGEIKGAMDPAIKAQVTYALVLEQTKLAQGDYARTASGTANTMKTLSAQFADAKVVIGDLVLPAFNALLKVTGLIIPILKSVAGYFKDNADAIKMLAILVGTATVAFYAFKAVMIVHTAVTAAYTAVLKAQKLGFTLAQIAAFNFKVAIMLLTAAMKANPIGLIVTGLTLLAAGFVYAWKKSETFRGIVIKVVQGILKWVELLVAMWGKFFSALGKIPGMGWAKKVGEGLDGISTKIQKASDGLSKLKSGFATTGAPGFIKGGTGGAKGDTTDGTTGGTTGSAAAAAKAAKDKADKIKKAMADVKKIYDSMNKEILEAQEKVAEATKRRDEDTAEAHKRYNETVADADKNFMEASAEANERYNERVADIEKQYAKTRANLHKKNEETIAAATKAYNEKVADLQDRFKEQSIKAEQDYANKKENIEKNYANKVLDLKKNFAAETNKLEFDAAKKSADLTKAATEKQISIVQQSVDRLRSAFASKTGANLSDAMGEDKSAGSLLSNLKAKLAGAKTLAQNAALLQGQGFSQTFIEQVVSAGPEIGSSLAESILAASPASIAEMQATFGELEKTSAHGLDALAATMNAGGKLATEELMKAYSAVSQDLANSLSDIQSNLTANLAEANVKYQEAMADAATTREASLAEATTSFNAAMTEAKKTLDEGLVEAAKALTEKIAEANKDLKEGLAEAEADLLEALADAKKDLNKALAEADKTYKEALASAQKTLTETLLQVQKTYKESLDKIAKDTNESIAALKIKLAELAAILAAFLSKQAAINALANAPRYTPFVPTTTTTTTDTTDKKDTTKTDQQKQLEKDFEAWRGNGADAKYDFNLTQNITYPTADVNDIAAKTISAIKFGSAGGLYAV